MILRMEEKDKACFCSSCSGFLMEWDEVIFKMSKSSSIQDFSYFEVVPQPSAILTPDETPWCKALICRQCGAVSLLEREPSGSSLASSRRHDLHQNHYNHRITAGRTASPNTWLNGKLLGYKRKPPPSTLSLCNIIRKSWFCQEARLASYR